MHVAFGAWLYARPYGVAVVTSRYTCLARLKDQVRIPECERLLERDHSKYAGHTCLRQKRKTMRGVYVTPSQACAAGYVISYHVFRDGAYRRVVVKVCVN